jgi:hypothetical protein
VSQCSKGSGIRDIAESGITKLRQNINRGGWSADSTVLCWENQEWAREQKFKTIVELYMEQKGERAIGTDFSVVVPADTLALRKYHMIDGMHRVTVLQKLAKAWAEKSPDTVNPY